MCVYCVMMCVSILGILHKYMQECGVQETMIDCSFVLGIHYRWLVQISETSLA